MIITSWNVAGLRACEKKGFFDFVDSFSPDVLCLQETKAAPEQLSASLVSPKGYRTLYASAEKKGYSGVSTWVKNTINVEHSVGLGEDIFDSEGRTIISEFDSFILFNCYFPNGQRDHGRVPYKLDFSRLVASRALELKRAKNKPVIICGDYNTAHHPIDLANPKTNLNSTGFLPIERAWMDEFEAQGFSDFFRVINPDIPDAYTWWTFRNDCRARNIGWRIDYFWGDQSSLSLLKDCQHRPDVMGSDHCPIFIELK